MVARTSRETAGADLFATDTGGRAEELGEEPIYSADAQARSDASVRNQLRNMALLEPIFRLQVTSSRAGGEEASFERIDVKALSLLTFDLVSHRMVTGLGAERDEIIRYLGAQAERMDPELAGGAGERIAEYILDGLTNGRERHAAFRVDYFDLPEESWRQRSFRLLEYESRIDGVLRYILTPEGITAFLSMLDVDPQLLQQAEELLIAKMIEKGSFEDALHLGRRAKARTIEYTQRLERMLRRYESYPGAIELEAINRTIDRSLEHVRERETEEGQLLLGLSTRQEAGGLEAGQLRLLQQLRELLDDCRQRHARLHTTLNEAPARFLTAQARLFRIREQSRIPSLEPDILQPLLERSIASLSTHGDAFTAAMSLPVIRNVFDPVTLTERIQDVRDPQAEEGDDALLNPTYEEGEELERFPAQCQQHMKAYLFDALTGTDSLRFSELLERARRDGYDEIERRCLAYLVIGAFCPESGDGQIDSQREGSFRGDWIAGVELSLRALGRRREHEQEEQDRD